MKLHIKEIVAFGAIAAASLVVALLTAHAQVMQNIFIGIFSSSLVVLFMAIISRNHKEKEILDFAFVKSCSVYNDLIVVHELYCDKSEKINYSIISLGTLHKADDRAMDTIDAVLNKCTDNISAYNTNFYQYSSYFRFAQDEFQSSFNNKIKETFKRRALNFIDGKLNKDHNYVAMRNIYFIFDSLRMQNIHNLSYKWLNILLEAKEIEIAKLQVREEKFKNSHCITEEIRSPAEDIDIQGKTEALTSSISDFEKNMSSFEKMLEEHILMTRNALDKLAIACGTSDLWDSMKNQRQA